MNLWNMETVWNVRRMYSALNVEMRYAHVPVSVFRPNLVAALMTNVNALAVDIDDRDVAVFETESDQPFCFKLVAQWKPTVETIELRGGSNDGRIIQFDRAGSDRLRVPAVKTFDAAFDLNPDVMAIAPTLKLETYDIDGWHETERRWLYLLKDTT